MKKVLINVEERELRVAILEDEQLVELYIESLDEKSILNNIYKGRVEDVLPGLKAAFVNVGLEKNAFLHFDDVRSDLLWAKYRELNPDMADEVPSAREALAAASAEVESETEEETLDGKRKRRRGRRGGKKRRPEQEDTYSPGLPVGVTEDDLEDDEEEDTEMVAATAAAAPAYSSAPAYRPVPVEVEGEDEDDAEDVAVASAPHNVETSSEGQAPRPYDRPHGQAPTPEELEARKQARIEKQRQRRERWEQKKLERQQRRQQERLERQQQMASMPAETAAAEAVEAIEPVATAYGTRGAASAYDTFSSFSPGNQRQQRGNLKAAKERYGDNFGNIALKQHRRVDHRDSQVDFFGPSKPSTEEHYSMWDEQQPDLGPVPGAGKIFLDGEFVRPSKYGQRRQDRRQRQGQGGGQGQHRDGQQAQRDGQGQRDGQQQNRGNKFGSNKRRGGKKRSMRKRDNRSFFALSADDILNPDDPVNEGGSDETASAKKPVRKKKAPAAEGKAAAEVAEKKPVRKAAAKKAPAATKATGIRKKKEEETGAQELPLDIEQTVEPAAKKAVRAKKPATPRTRKAPAKAEPQEESLKLQADDLEAAVAETAAAEPHAPKETQVDQAEIKPAAEKASVEAEPYIEKAVPQDVPLKEAHVDTVGDVTLAHVSEPAAAADEATAGQQSGPETHTDQQQDRGSRRSRSARSRDRRRGRDRDREARNGQAPVAPADETTGPAEEGSAGSEATATLPAASQTPAPQQQQQPPQRYPQIQHLPRHDQRKKIRRPLFQEVFKKGDEIMVQVVKEEIGQKGARISSYVSLPGRYLVLLPYPNQEGGISRKVEDIKERKRLKSLLRDISTDETAFIIRTAGVFQNETEIRKDVEFLSHEWSTIADRYKMAGASALVYDDHDILYRLARDVFDDSVGEILIDSHIECDKLKGILSKLIPSLTDKVKLYSGAENIFHKFGVTKQIQKAARRKVWLKSGGYLIIDEAEALTAIDVNTGKSVGKDDQEKLILRTNLESARAVARELKLRDIGGLIVIDFIDMKDPRNREQVLNELKLQLRKDRSKTSVSAISEFGLVEMTRKRVRRSLRKTLFMDCPYCQGAGAVLNEQQIWLHIKHEIVRQLESIKPAPALSITVNPRIRAYIDQNYRDVIRRLEQKYDTEIKIAMSDIFHIENYQIEKAETGVISGSATMPTR